MQLSKTLAMKSYNMMVPFPIISLSDYDSVRFKKQKQEYPEQSLALGLNSYLTLGICMDLMFI